MKLIENQYGILTADGYVVACVWADRIEKDQQGLTSLPKLVRLYRRNVWIASAYEGVRLPATVEAQQEARQPTGEFMPPQVGIFESELETVA